jgi:ribosomal protein L13E
MDKQSAQSAMNRLRARLDRSVPQAKLVYGRRLAAAAGFSAGELDSAGLGLEQARSLGLATDEQRMSSLGVNVEALEKFLKR